MSCCGRWRQQLNSTHTTRGQSLHIRAAAAAAAEKLLCSCLKQLQQQRAVDTLQQSHVPQPHWQQRPCQPLQLLPDYHNMLL
jgi:hypothetical protein